MLDLPQLWLLDVRLRGSSIEPETRELRYGRTPSHAIGRLARLRAGLLVLLFPGWLIGVSVNLLARARRMAGLFQSARACTEHISGGSLPL